MLRLVVGLALGGVCAYLLLRRDDFEDRLEALESELDAKAEVFH